MLRGAFLLLLAAAGLSGWAWCAAAPSVQRLEPLGLRPGTTSRLTVVGDNLSGAIDLWSSFASEIAVDDREKEVGFNVTVPSDTTPGIGALRFIGTNGASSPHLLLIDPMPAVPSWGTNRSSLAAQAVAVPGAVDAVCAEVRSDYYRFTGKRGQRLTVEVVAQRIASPLDPYLRILDLDRRELAETDDTPGLGSDPRIDFKCPRSGAYLIEVRDTRYGGGPRYRYRLRLGEPLPAPLPFLLKRELAAHTSPLEEPPRLIGRAPSGGPGQCRLVSWPAIIEGSFSKANQRDAYELTVAQGDLLLLSGRTRSLGSPCDLFLQLQTTNGTKIAEANANSADEGMLTNRFNESGPCRLIVEELNGRAGSTLRYEVRLAKAGPGFSLATEVERISLPPGESIDLEVRAERRDYDGPISLTLAGLDERFVVTNAVIPARTNLTKLRVTARADTALGDALDFSILGKASINGTEVSTRASTMPALHSVFPELRYPPRELDGLLTVTIAGTSSSTPASATKKKKK